MKSKAATETKNLKIGADLITIEQVKGDENLFRININNAFKGYVIRKNGEYSLTGQTPIPPVIYARIIDCVKNGLCT
ncbi:hypothetical protein [Pedobacter agri]|uniref:Uncharacterized protein n=1 Tax=Pedobacter agri TaxID=454586 RepID=A0A9X3DF56_9SPHI|nr:hypothetical protein [Pedobacter agri]MCX3266524.1 hypothetical protein [Pedobacter agri]